MLIRTFTFAAIASATLAGSALFAQTAQTAAQRTITGCVYEEKDVPGRAPNLAERAGILEDYILAEITPAEAAKPVSTGGSLETPATYSMYKLEHAADSELQAMVGKRVEVMGKIDAESGDLGVTGTSGRERAGDDKDQSIGPDQIELPEFEVSSIREIAGTCPATPSK